MNRHELQPPGAGLPPFEKFYLNIGFKVGSAVMSDDKALKLFDQISNKILLFIEPVDIDLLSQTILTPRLQGIEDSSRNWSVLMVLEHLNLVNRSIMSTIRELHGNRAPFGEVAIADYKPDPNVDAGVIDEFRETNRRYRNFVVSHKPLRTSSHHFHPWFGFLDGHQWHVLAAVHQRIHSRQIQKILTLHGIA